MTPFVVLIYYSQKCQLCQIQDLMFEGENKNEHEIGSHAKKTPSRSRYSADRKLPVYKHQSQLDKDVV